MLIPNKKNFLLLLCTALLLQLLAVFSVCLAAEPKVVRVGWYESAWHRTDSFGRRSGYGYEYQQRIAAYTGWKYEYVEGSWSQLYEKLLAGEIDLLSDVSYTEERAEKLLFSSHAMGAEDYHIFILPSNTKIRPDDYSTMNGKTVAVNKNSIQEKLFRAWAEANDVHPRIVQVTENVSKLLEKLSDGTFDMLVTLDTYGNMANVLPVVKIGSAESFFGINKNRPDLKKEADGAMGRILDSNRNFNQELTQKFNKANALNSFLSVKERNWLSENKVIRIGYQNHLLPFCAAEEPSQKLTGALKDFLEFAEHAPKNAKLKFQTRAFDDTQAALAALSRGEIDCVFPASLSPYDAEQANVLVTDPLIRTEIYVAVRADNRLEITSQRPVKVAVSKGDPGYGTFLKDNFPKWRIVQYDSIVAAFEAVAHGEADCTLVRNYRVNRVNDNLRLNRLLLFTTDRTSDMSFAIRKDDISLYSIFNKIIHLVRDTSLNSSLISYGYEENKVTFSDYLRDNLIYVILAISATFTLFIWMQFRNMRAKADARERERIIAQTEHDDLTGLYHWNYFLLYVNQIYSTNVNRPMDAVIMNIERFRSVNSLHGRAFGDRVLSEIGSQIEEFVKATGGIASRSEADHFNIYCPQRDDWQKQLETFQRRISSLFPNASIHLRMGVKHSQKKMQPIAQFDCARIASKKLRGNYATQAVIYDDTMAQNEDRDQRLLNDLSHALENNEFKVFYQPKYDIQGWRPQLKSAEALVRWRHPELGMLPPNVFVPLFERTGRITELDVYVWNETARQIAEWSKIHGMTLPVSVNLSRADMFDPHLVATLDSIVERHGIKTADLKLEVTESAYTNNPEQMMKIIGELRNRGYRIEMDDFGSGYSSLNMLSSIPIDVLKMDIAFIRNIERSEKDFHLVKLVVDIARSLKLSVVAEGVETEGQLNLLRKVGCNIVQGYYFSRPLPADDFERLIIGKA